MKKIFILLTLGFSLISVVHAQSEPEKIDSLLAAYASDESFNGVVLVSVKGKILFRKAYGLADREWHIPTTPETKFKIASISKPFTALIMLQLVEENKVRLEGKITDYIPDYSGKKGNEITIYHLLTHTSGILESLNPEQEKSQERLPHNLSEMVGYAEKADLYFEPGTGYHYSNLGYSILAQIAETVTQKPFHQLLEARITQPIGMKDTRHFSANFIEINMARGYEYNLLSGFENASFFDPSYPVGAGSMISTVDDLLKFDQALSGKILLGEKLTQVMFSPTKLATYGCGWEINKKKYASASDSVTIYSHSGSINGFGSFMARIERDSVFVAVLKNSRSNTYISPAFAPAIGHDILSILYGKDVLIPKNSIAKRLGFLIGTKGIDTAIADYYQLKKTKYNQFNLEKSELNKLGIELLFKYKMNEAALKVFEINMKEFPESYNTYDSYAYVLMQMGEFSKSIYYYKKGFQIAEKYPDKNNSDSVKSDIINARKSTQEMEIKLKEKHN
ncbi:MAG: beta-lactamase family protein [Bacteroidetes bacterium]|nr:beta-lactamase family protein [Bacteroidota bacterium]